MSTIHWTENDHPRSARRRSESIAAAPSRVVIVGDDTTANTGYRLARSGTGLLYQGDYHNARQLLHAIRRRIDRDAGRRVNGYADFAAYRVARAERARILGRLIVLLDEDYELGLRRAPNAREACTRAHGEPVGGMCVALSELHGVLSADQWHHKGVLIPALNAHVHPCYGVFSPVRGEYIDLVARAPLPAGAQLAFDLGTGTGVLAALMARRGVSRVVTTDINPRAVACATANLAHLGYSTQTQVIEADLYPPGKADLIVCNPPWLPAQPTSTLEQGIYDPDSDMLHRFIDGLAEHLAPGGEARLILSNLAELLGLRTRDDLMRRVYAAGLRVIGRRDTSPIHPRAADRGDPLHAARRREITTLWQLALAHGTASRQSSTPPR